MPPIYQLEVAAQAIYWTARHRRRELYVGSSSLAVIVGNKLFPGLADRYLARTGFDSQQTEDPVDEDRPNNLYTPVPGDHGAHGIFDSMSRNKSTQFWINTNRGWLAAAAGALAGAALAALARR